MVTLPNPNTSNIFDESLPNYTFSTSMDNSISNNSSSESFISNDSIISAKSIEVVGRKISDIAFATVGDTITYTIEVLNSSSTTITNTTLSDPLPGTGLSFITDSVKVNNNAQPGADPTKGLVNIGTIANGSSATVTFQIKTTTLPVPNPINNTAIINYQSNGLNNILNIGPATTDIVQLNVNKQTSSAFATVGDTITYTLSLNNTGSVDIPIVQIFDTIPNSTTFIKDSVTLNGFAKPGEVPTLPDGLNIGSVKAGSSPSIVTFQVMVETIPTGNPINNSAQVSFTYNSTATTLTTTTIVSNIVSTTISKGVLNVTKQAAPAEVTVGDTITYTIAMASAGNSPVNNVLLLDSIPLSTKLIQNSVVLNGVTLPGATPNPPNGLNVGQIASGSSSTLTFQVTVTTIPTINPLPNSANISYQFNVGPTIITSQTITNVVTTPVSKGALTSVKSALPTYATLGDTITYTILLNSTGNVPVETVKVIDTIPLGTTFVPNSVNINNQASPGDPSNIDVGSIPAGLSTTITFQVTVTTIPTINPTPNSGTTTFNFRVAGNAINGSNYTNTISIPVSLGELNATKAFSPQFTTVGDTITYSITLNSTGNVPVNNVILNDTIPLGTQLIPNSVSINNLIQPSSNGNPNNGINIGTIANGSVSTVSFSVLITTLPTPNPIPNSAKISFSYNVSPTITKTTSINTAIVTTPVSKAILSSNKSTSPINVSMGDTITYTVALTNTGNVSADAVIFSDTLPSGLEFIPNSITVNNNPNAGANPAGINLGSIPANSTSTLSFQAKVITIPNANPIINSSTTIFSYVVSPTIAKKDSTNSNTVNNTISFGEIIATKTALPPYVTVGDTVTYTLSLKNAGNVPVSNIIVTDTIPLGTQFVQNSVMLNNLQLQGANPNPPNGVGVGIINPGSVSTVSFKVIVTTIPTINPIPNSANVICNYSVGPTITNNNSSNTSVISIPVSKGDITLTKQATPAAATLGDTITYTIVINSIGNVPVNNVTLLDTIPPGTQFVPNSLTLNNVAQIGSNPNPPLGVNLGSINSGTTSTISFKVLVTTIPTINPIQNSSTVMFNYSVGPTIIKNDSGHSNVVTTPISFGSLSSSKTGNPLFATVGDTITYNLLLTASGNVPVNNIILTDTIPPGTTLVPNSITINGIQSLGANPSPPGGINIGSLNPGSKSNISFKVTVDTIPTINPLSNSATATFTYSLSPTIVNNGFTNTNTITIPVSQGNLISIKQASPDNVTIGDTITYTISLNSIGNVPVNNVVLKDSIPNGTILIPFSATINNLVQSGANNNPSTGINVGTINPGSISTVTFKVLVNTLPTPNPVPNSATALFNYSVGPTIIKSNSSNTNIVTTPVSKGSITSTKQVSPINATIGDTITYTISLSNSGNVDLSNVICSDTIPPGTSYVSNSLTLNGVQQNGGNPTGINVGNLAINSTSTITFQVNVSTIPSPNPISNSATTIFTYPIGPTITSNGTSTTNSVSTQISSATLTSTKQASPDNVTIGDTITYTIMLNSFGNVPTNNIIITDTIPPSLTFIPNSIYVNALQLIGATPSTISVGSINPNSNASIVFQAIVNTIPTVNPIPNSASSSFVYSVGPTIVNTGYSNTNITTTTVSKGILSATKQVDLASATLGDTITYTIVLNSLGNVPVNNINLIDTLPSNIMLIPSSVTVNGFNQASIDPDNLNINIGSINPGSNSTVSFQVSVIDIPIANPINNSATATFNYSIGPTKIITDNTITNSVSTNISFANLDTIKESTPPYVTIGDTITYTVYLSSFGNVPIENILFIDTTPDGTSLVADSVTINNIVQSGANPSNLNIGSLNPNSKSVISFQVTVDTLPAQNPIINSSTTTFAYNINPTTPINGSSISNTTNTLVSLSEIMMTKTVDATIATIGDSLTYTIGLNNTGNVAADNITLIDTIPNGTIFNDNSVTLNGMPQPGANPSPPSGFNLGSINSGESTTITFQVTIVSIPDPNIISNIASVDYTYNSVPDSGHGWLNYFNIDNSLYPQNIITGNASVSNTATTEIKAAICNANKFVDQTFADLGTTITYTIVIENVGNVTASNVLFYDTIPIGATFIANSLTVNSTPKQGNPQTGISLDPILASSTVTVAYQVIINDLNIPDPNPVPNSADITFNFDIS